MTRLTVCAVAQLRIRELGGIRCYSPREKKRQRESEREGKMEREREREMQEEREYVEKLQRRMHLIFQAHMAGLFRAV